MEPVRSTRNPRVAEAVRLRRAQERKARGLTLLEGPNLVGEAFAAGVRVHPVFGVRPRPEWVDISDWVEVTPEVLDRLADTKSPRGPIGVMPIPAPAQIRRDHLVIDVADPGNAGTLIRTAAAFGFDVVFRPGSVDPWSPKVLRAAAGAHFRTAVGVAAPDGAGTVATVVKGGIHPATLSAVLDPDRTWGLLIGSEARGLAGSEVETADVSVSIPMPGGTESLNAAVAAAIVAYELARWRNAAVDVPRSL
jgi:RNA methyltransferase, TrmH family